MVLGDPAWPARVASIFVTTAVRLCIVSMHAGVFMNARYKAMTRCKREL